MLGYYLRAPRSREEEPWFDFSEGDNAVYIENGATEVWPVYMLPCPDLMLVAAGDLLAYKVPKRFRNYLAYRAGGNLLKADGDMAGAGVNFGLAKEQLAYEQTRAWDALPGWMKRVRLRRRQFHHHRRFDGGQAGAGGAPAPPDEGGQGIGGEGGGGMA